MLPFLFLSLPVGIFLSFSSRFKATFLPFWRFLPLYRYIAAASLDDNEAGDVGATEAKGGSANDGSCVGAEIYL